MSRLAINGGIQAAQQIEVYWMALIRDVPFSEFATNELTKAAAGEYTYTPEIGHGGTPSKILMPDLFRFHCKVAFLTSLDRFWALIESFEYRPRSSCLA